MKAIVWGAGGTGKEFLLRKLMYHNYEIVCVVDSNENLWGEKISGYTIASPNEIRKQVYDRIIVCSLYYDEIKKRLREEFDIHESVITTYQEIDKEICDIIIGKYKECKDPDVVATLEEFKKGTSSILGAYNPPFEIYDEVIRDEEGWPYIMFEGKRMYFPYKYEFIKRDGKEVVPDIKYEQGADSPHLYLPEGYSMPEGAVIVDAGVCEGNFALRFVDKASLIYLIEANESWMAALERTFKPYKEKVVYVNKFLSGTNNRKEITIDKLVNGRLDFLKMDIEGSEVESLLGARRVLTSNKVQCAICSYHRQYDEKYIEFILQNYGYRTAPAKGFIFFPYDENMIDTMDLRRGVIYGMKE